MIRKTMHIGVTALLLGVLSLLTLGAALAEENVGVIRGRLFVDANENGSFDEGEQVLSGVNLELADGEQILTVPTAEDGTFSVNVGAGVWRVNLVAPDGYTVLNDASREVTIAADGTTEAVMDFALQAVPAEVSQPQSEAAAEEAQTADAEAVVAEAPAEPTLLPETGAGLPRGAGLAMLALLVLLLVGVVLVVFGRRVASH